MLGAFIEITRIVPYSFSVKSLAETLELAKVPSSGLGGGLGVLNTVWFDPTAHETAR